MSSSRRHFLCSALVLPSALAASAFAQDKKDRPLVPFADFENGWDDWTVEGLAFDTRPATGDLFPGKISGFGGRGFVCTLHPRKGNAATGKAVSREFVIEKPFVTFKIGGGNFPGQACLNLVVDNKIERTATGDGTANLSEKSWDVSALLGKKARLEIIDSTVSDQRGYILVDDIAFATRPTDLGLITYESGPTLAQFGIGRTFFQQSTSHFTQPYGDLEFGPVFDFGVVPAVHQQLIDAVCARVYRLQHNPSRSIESTAKILQQIADEEFTRSGVSNPSSFLHQWMYAEAVCAYTVANVRYDRELLARTQNKGKEAGLERWRQQDVKIVYGLAQPLATCDGFSRLTQTLAQLCGITAYHIDGTMRSWGIEGDATNHGWVIFEFIGGVRVPADTTVNWGREDSLTKVRRKVFCSKMLPKTVRDWEAFLCGHYENSVIVELIPNKGGRIIPAKIGLNQLSYEEWKRFNTSPQWEKYSKMYYYLQLEAEYLIGKRRNRPELNG